MCSVSDQLALHMHYNFPHALLSVMPKLKFYEECKITGFFFTL